MFAATGNEYMYNMIHWIVIFVHPLSLVILEGIMTTASKYLLVMPEFKDR